MKQPYSDYVSYCMRFYIKYPTPVFQSEADKLKWETCDSVIKTFSDYNQQILIQVYTRQNTIPDNVHAVARLRNIHPSAIWNLVNELERKVAKQRKLI